MILFRNKSQTFSSSEPIFGIPKGFGLDFVKNFKDYVLFSMYHPQKISLSSQILPIL